MSLGRKNEEQASMMMPRRLKTNPTLALLVATRMAIGYDHSVSSHVLK